MMKQEKCPKCGLVLPEGQFICPRCWWLAQEQLPSVGGRKGKGRVLRLDSKVHQERKTRKSRRKKLRKRNNRKGETHE